MKKKAMTTVLIAMMSSGLYGSIVSAESSIQPRAYSQQYQYQAKPGLDWWLSNSYDYYYHNGSSYLYSWSDSKPYMWNGYAYSFKDSMGGKQLPANNGEPFAPANYANWKGYYIYSYDWSRNYAGSFNSYYGSFGLYWSDVLYNRTSYHASNQYRRDSDKDAYTSTSHDAHYKGGNDKGPWKDSLMGNNSITNTKKGYISVFFRRPIPSLTGASIYNGFYTDGSGKNWARVGADFSVKMSWRDDEGKIDLRAMGLRNAANNANLGDMSINKNGETRTSYLPNSYLNGYRVDRISNSSDRATYTDSFVWNMKTEGDYYFEGAAYNDAGVFNIGDYEPIGIRFSTDGQGPNGSNGRAWDVTGTSVKVGVDGVTDARSGLNYSTVKAKIYPTGNPGTNKVYNLTHNGSNNFSTTASLSGLPAGADFTVEFSATDNVGNTRIISTTTFKGDINPPTVSIRPNTTAWTNQNVTLTISATDDRTGVSSITKPDGTTTTQNPTTAVITDNKNGIVAKATDGAGNVGSASINVGNIDKTSPTLSLSITPTAWTSGNVTIKGTHSDGLSGVSVKKWAPGNQTKEYFANAGTTISGDTFVATNNGTYTMYVADRAGNSRVATINVTNIDRTAPGISITGNPTNWVAEATLTASVSDSQSGPRDITLPDNSKVNENSATYKITQKGTYTFKATDNVGNQGTSSVVVNRIDEAKPIVSISGDINNWINRDALVNLAASDSESGVNRIEYKLSGATIKGWTTYTTGIVVQNEGVTTITARSYDNVGRVSDERAAEIRIDKTKPTVTPSTANITDNRNINIQLSNIVDVHSKIKEVRTSNKSDFTDNPKVTSLDGLSNTSITHTLDKKGTAKDNYTTRTVYIELRDNANNKKVYTLNTTLQPKIPNVPIIVTALLNISESIHTYP